MKSLSNLMGNTPSSVVDASRHTTAAILSVDRARKKDLDTVVFKVRVKAHTEKVYYDVVIELYPLEVKKDTFQKPSEASPAWVSCSCPHFLYNCEYALAKAGSSEIKYSNGKPPVITNPKMIPYLCKHLYAASGAAVKRIQRYAKGDKTYKYI